MAEAAERVEAWRRAKRHEGYRQVALWLPADFKGKLDALAYARHQDIATCVMDAVEYLENKQGTLKPLRLDAHQQRRLEEKITTNVLQRLATLGVLDAAAVATEAAGAPPPATSLPAGMKHCKQGHAYPATRAECPHCARARKRRQMDEGPEAHRLGHRRGQASEWLKVQLLRSHPHNPRPPQRTGAALVVS